MSRKLNTLEQQIHQAALVADDQTLTQKDLVELSENVTARTEALNFLLSTGLLKGLKDSNGKIVFRAVGKAELDVTKDLSVEESLVYSHIKASSNTGIWTKHLKVKTELHQTVIDRCLKTLTQKKLVKAEKGTVQHPTRKMYMLYDLQPSVEVTGGPWYTDKELDTEFIKLLMAACLKFIRDRTFPRIRGSAVSDRLLYPISSSPVYPSAIQVQTFLNKSRITETQLTVEHVEMLLNVLIIDGEIEKVPAMGAALWESATASLNNNASEEDIESALRKRKRDGEGGSDDVDAASLPRKRKLKGKSKATTPTQEPTSDPEGVGASNHISHPPSRSHSRSKGKKKQSNSPSPSQFNYTLIDNESSEAMFVYRAIHQERLPNFGWSQAPCGKCPTFDFCKTGGPVNPEECVYYGQWLGMPEAKIG